MKINFMLSESAAFTPAQEKKIVEGANLTLLSVSAKPGLLVKPGATIPANMRAVNKVVFTIDKIDLSSKGTITQIHLSGKRTKNVKITARELKKLLDSPVPKKTDRLGTKSMRFSTASDLSGSEMSAKERKTSIQKAQAKLNVLDQAAIGSKKTSNAKIGDNAKLAAIAEELRTLNIRRKALEDQYIKLKKKLDPKAYRNVKDDSSLKRRANRKRA